MKGVIAEIVKVAKEVVALSPLDDAIQTLDGLQQLSDNLDSAFETFSEHYRLAAVVDVNIDSQKDVFRKADMGLNKAKAARGAIKEILDQFPEDKTAARAMKEAETMVNRFAKHREDARKVIMVFSKKQMPDGLKKFAGKIAKFIRDRLNNPDDLLVSPWVVGMEYARDTNCKGMNFQVELCVFKDAEKKWSERMSAYENSASKEGPYAFMNSESLRKDPKALADMFVKNLNGWSGLKGEGEARIKRQSVFNLVRMAVESACRSLGSTQQRDEEDNNGFTRVTCEYRSGLPKDGAYTYGESRYEEMVEAEITRCRRLLEPKLAPYKQSIERLQVLAEEKGWIYIEVTLK